MAIYCLFVTTQSTVVALIAEKDLSAWQFPVGIGLVAVLYVVSNHILHTYLVWMKILTSNDSNNTNIPVKLYVFVLL